MRRCLSVLLLVAVAGFTAADEPKIVGPKQVDPYKVVKLSVTGLDAKAGVLWKVRPADPKNAPDFGLRGKRNLRDLEFVAPPGGYVVELTIVAPPLGTGEAFSIDELTHPVTIGTPVDPVVPDPVNPPNPPGPPKPVPVPDVDAQLVARFKAALDADAKGAFPAGGSKDNAAKLADVYLFAAAKLASDNAADWPATVGKLFEVVAAVSVNEKKVPRPPYFGAVRAVAGEILGSGESTAELDAAKRADFAGRFKRAGLALKEAAK